MFNIYVGNLSFDVTEAEVSGLFSQYGTVDRVNLITDRQTGRPRGFGFVEMSDESAGRAAIEALNGVELMGRAITVNEARPRAERERGGGGGRGGGGRDGGRRERW